MQSYNIGDFLVEFDKTVTADWYENSEGWDCECGDCQKFLALAKRKQLPFAVIELLSIFGALPEKPTYVCELLLHHNGRGASTITQQLAKNMFRVRSQYSTCYLCFYCQIIRCFFY